MSKAGTGWVLCGNPWRGKYHWIAEDGRSLCRRWFAFDHQQREQGNDGSPDNCAECRKRKGKLTAPTPEPESADPITAAKAAADWYEGEDGYVRAPLSYEGTK